MLVPYDGSNGDGDGRDDDDGGRFAVYARGREETSVKRREAVEAKRRAMGTTIGARLLRACGWASPKAEETRRRARARVRGKDVGRDGRGEERVGEEENTRTRDVCDG